MGGLLPAQGYAVADRAETQRRYRGGHEFGGGAATAERARRDPCRIRAEIAGIPCKFRTRGNREMGEGDQSGWRERGLKYKSYGSEGGPCWARSKGRRSMGRFRGDNSKEIRATATTDSDIKSPRNSRPSKARRCV